MATKTKAKGAVERLAELDQAIVEAEARRDEIRTEQRQALQAVERAKGRILDAEERRGAGEDMGEEIAAAERELAEALEAADVRTQHGGSALVGGESDDPVQLYSLGDQQVPAVGVWGARIAGAERVVEDAILARDQYGRHHFAEIAAEEAAADGPARDALVEAWETLQAAGNAYALRIRRWHQLAPFAEIDPASIPVAPLTGDVLEVAERFERGIDVPTPPLLRG
ncbi:MAG TPA: hypothetical protein VFX44_08500 [Solirubrobacterales bacterium]|nr:hypothetical protein [Solirubrobacterales bacterium]